LIVNRRSALLAAAAGALLSMSLVAAAEPHTVLVFAAASLTNAQDEVNGIFTTATKVPVKSSYASSSVLARQIEAGAPAELFVSADTDWMDYLEKRDLLVPGSRREILANRLVLISAAGSTVQLVPAPGFDLAGALGGGHLAMGNPDSVPAGIYGKAALQKLGVWSQVEGKVASADNVRSALALVSRGEAPLGIVYRTDALVDKGVRIVSEFPEDSHAPIHYPAALVKGAGPEARRLLDFLSQPAARQVFSRYGFTPLP
jgi:molybdate transport system substrate-binding protein